MAAPTRDQLLVAVRAWLLAAASSAGLANGQVVKAESEGLRPEPPFLEVRLVVFRNPEGRPEVAYRGDPVFSYVRTNNRDTVSVNAYGAGAEDWLSRAVDFLDQPSIQAQLATAGICIEVLGGMNNLSGLLDERFEIRFQQDFEVSYASLSDGEAQVEAEHFVVEHNIVPDGSFTADLA